MKERRKLHAETHTPRDVSVGSRRYQIHREKGNFVCVCVSYCVQFNVCLHACVCTHVRTHVCVLACVLACVCVCVCDVSTWQTAHSYVEQLLELSLRQEGVFARHLNTGCYVILNQPSVSYVRLCYDMICYVMICYVMICYDMICYVMI
jgi:hypothetical protein